jgi:hypothetical protein
MQLESLIRELNPKIFVNEPKYVSPNFNRPPRDEGIPEYVINMDKSTVNPYPEAESINRHIDYYNRMNKRPSYIEVSDILENARVSQDVNNRKRMIAENEMQYKVPELNQGQVRKNITLGEIYNNQMIDFRLNNEISQNVTEKNLEKQETKLLMQRAKARQKRNY